MSPTLDVAALLDALTTHFPRAVRPHEPLARHGTFGVGGPADAWVNLASEDDLLALVALARAHGWPLMLAGNGTNVLYADGGARGIVARMALDDWRLEALDHDHALLTAAAGVSLPKLVNELAEAGYSGLEWGAGVPGTVGGAVVSNAGAHGACVADTLRSARVLFTEAEGDAPPQIRELAAAELGLAYRHSRFRAERRITFGDDGLPVAAPRAAIEPREMITGATFLLARDEPERIRGRVRAYRQHRKDTRS
ncbi:MAG TPA: FAD-binding protein, partial [Gemmatimonadales bacterium]|nr:FAD-binding protein [Gemmatimonadales bacterium]